MDIGRVLQNLDARVKRVERSPRLSHASIDATSVEVRDSDGGLRGLLGVQADGTTAVNIVNGPPPPTPSAPIVASVLGGVTVSWDGLFADGAVIPLDWARVEVHAAIAPVYDPVPATLQGTIETAQGATVVVPCDTDVYVRLVARTTSGTASTPTEIVGPYGPTPVVADDIADGIVTTVKLADDAVTQAKVAVGAIGSTQISDNAVTTPKIVAGAVQTAQLDAEAVNASKLAAGAVTTAKLDALAVTADKIAANAITVGKINAGAVDATALSATAITGKTITGGTITGSVLQTAASGERVTINEGAANKVLVYDSSGTAVGELSGLGLALVGTNGSLLILDPDAAFPNFRLTNSDQTAEAVMNVSGTEARLGLNSGQFTGSTFSDMKWRTFFGSDFWVAERLRDTATSTVVGGRIFLGNDHATIGNYDTVDSSLSTNLLIYAGFAQLQNGRLEVVAPASSNPAVYAYAASGHTGHLLRLLLAGVEKFRVDKDGNTAAAGILTAGNIAFGRITITPSAANTPTSGAVTGLNLKGTTFRAVATAATTLPGTVVTGVGCTGVSSTGMNVWVTRTNTTATGIDWMIIGE